MDKEIRSITMSHGSGGDATSSLIEEIFKGELGNEYLDRMEDSAVVPGGERLALTTDSFVVKPPVFDGGNIGRLAVCGTVNDILTSGAVPKYLTAGFVLEEGLSLELLKTVVRSMAETAREAGVIIVSGDTKVIEHAAGKDEGSSLIINTAGVGILKEGVDIGPRKLEKGDKIILSGNLGEHEAAILKERLNIKNDLIKSDNAPLKEMVMGLMDSGLKVHAIRDVTRGGLATVLNEFASSSGRNILISEEKLPVSGPVRDFAGLLGLDPLYMGNEGKMVFAVGSDDAEEALRIIRNSKYGENAAVIGTVLDEDSQPTLAVETLIGGKRIAGPLYGEGLPRLC